MANQYLMIITSHIWTEQEQLLRHFFKYLVHIFSLYRANLLYITIYDNIMLLYHLIQYSYLKHIPSIFFSKIWV